MDQSKVAQFLIGCLTRIKFNFVLSFFSSSLEGAGRRESLRKSFSGSGPCYFLFRTIPRLN